MMLNFLGDLELNPHWTLWIIIPLLPVAVALILYLYVQQRKLASNRAVAWLTIIRLLLLLLVVALFFRPAATWIHTKVSSGTLWLVVDQSPSMQVLDKQATPAEHIHWAEALRYLPPKMRPAKPDLLLARLTAVTSEFFALRPDEGAMSPAKTPEADRQRAKDLAAQLLAWAKRLDAIRYATADDPAFHGGRGASALDGLERVSNSAHNGAASAAAAADLRDANADIPWLVMIPNLKRAEEDIAVLAADADADFIREKGADADVTSAIARVTDVSRGDLAYDFLTNTQKRSEKTIPDLLKQYRVRVASFSDTAQAAGTVDESTFADTLKSAANASSLSVGQSTNIVTALQMVGEQIAPDEPASIILVTDGRHNTAGDPTETARLLAARGIHVYGLLVGSHEVSADAAVDQIDSPEWVFKGDTLKAAALLRFDGLAGKRARVEFRRGDVLIDTQNLDVVGNQMTRRVEFTDLPPEGEKALEYEVRIAEMPGEVNLQNNRSTFRVAVKKDKLYALVIEDRPRWEYRYLAAYLSRDARLKLQTIMLNPAVIGGVAAPAPVKASPANPRQEAQILPQTRDEWQAFDLIILGDIPAGTLTNAQQQFIAADVRDKGATLITIAGQRSMPQALADGPLAELLPVTLAPQWDDAAIARHSKYGFRPGLAPEGNGSVLGQLALDPGANSLLWSNLSPWYWHSAFTQAKPSASVIWSITEAAPGGAAEPGPDAQPGAGTLNTARKNALLATMSVGLGKSLYLASDQSWRLRQVYGSNVQDRFWGQVLRWAVGSDLPAGGKFVRFGSNQPRYAQGQPVVITARVLREDLTPYSGLTFSAIARPVKAAGTAGGGGAAENSTEGRFVESPETPGYYHATLAGLMPGDSEISLSGAEVERLLNVDPSVTQKTLMIKITPQLDLEQRNMNTDPELLARIAEAGGGFSLDANYADVLASNLPEIERREQITEEVGFFTDPSAVGTQTAHWAFLALFAILLTLEWTLRKTAGLV